MVVPFGAARLFELSTASWLSVTAVESVFVALLPITVIARVGPISAAVLRQKRACSGSLSS